MDAFIKCFYLNFYPQVLGNKPAKCEIDRMKSSDGQRFLAYSQLIDVHKFKRVED